MAVKRSFPITNHADGPCPACGSKTGKQTIVTGVLHCSCKGLVGKCHRGEALALVELDKPVQNACRAENLRYFNFTWIDTGEKVEGWFDRTTLRQVNVSPIGRTNAAQV